jgi:hypothetical protein
MSQPADTPAPERGEPAAAPSEADTLLPCPFCGGEAYPMPSGEGISCENTSCAAFTVVAEPDAWNRRAAPPADALRTAAARAISAWAAGKYRELATAMDALRACLEVERQRYDRLTAAPRSEG